ncbi:hypothetical protein P5673_022774 [Acropora cervicornis]|uniref:Uncharacterized protein n=1 Tax=Acropora cervicornis TaxID=6130 RepID=A0AAD9UZ77_ACRCE|nr:hypothetical protein P5673_022774 [Acropora cervicornis]
MAVVPKSGHRLLIKRIIKEELTRADLEAQPGLEQDLMELVEEYPFLFSTSGEVCMVGLLYSCSSVELSPPACHQA